MRQFQIHLSKIGMTAFFSFIVDKKHSLCYHIDILLKIQLPIKREKKYERIVIYDYPADTPK